MLTFLPFAKKFASRLIIALVCTTILSSAGIVMVNNMIDSRFNNIKTTKVNVASDTGSSEPANFLLIGSDTRAFAESDEDKQSFVDAQGETGQRSDTMMIIHVDPKKKKTLVMAIPRDAIVDIPGIGKKKINASFNTDLGGGPDKVIETIQTNFDISIHHYVELDFESFRQIVSALGGVNVYFPAPARDHKINWNTGGKAGCLKLNGNEALSYVRSRYYEQYIDGRWKADLTSNFGRIARQQEFMRRVAALAVAKSFTDPLKGRDVVDAVIKKLVVDDQLKKDDIFKLMNAFKGVDPNDPEHVQFETLPVKSQKQNGSWNDIIQTSEAEPLLEQFRSFSTSAEPATTLPRPSTVQVRVLNATSRKGLAATVIDQLHDIGFAAAGTGNASRSATTEIHYTAASKAKAQLVARYINGTLIQDTAISGADIEVKLGTSFVSVNSKPSTTKTTTKKTGSTTTLPNTTVKASSNGVVETNNCPA